MKPILAIALPFLLLPITARFFTFASHQFSREIGYLLGGLSLLISSILMLRRFFQMGRQTYGR